MPFRRPFAWNGLLFVTSGAGGDSDRPIVAIRPGASGDITPPADGTRSDRVVWYDRTAGGTYLPTPVIYKDALYVLNDNGHFFAPQPGDRRAHLSSTRRAWGGGVHGLSMGL
jgi:hypothetical protein